MRRIFTLFFLLTIAQLFQSCSTDFSTIAPYKETMVVYGILNPTDHVHYIRINKAYLGQGNTLIMAQQKDSINYAQVLDVTVQQIVNGSVAQTYTLQPDTTVLKDSGIFNYPYQVLYKMQDTLFPEGSNYKIIIHNRQTGLTATSTTTMVSDFSVNNLSGVMNFVSPIYYTVNFNSASNAWYYNFIIRFNYKEINLLSHDTASKYVDWNFGDQVTGDNPPASITYDHIYRPDLYRIVGNAIAPADTNVIRRIIDSPPIDLIFGAGSEDLYTYQQLTQPEYGLVQDRPLFNDIQNGIGLFTSRYILTIPRNMDGYSRAAFDTSSYTHDLYFH